MWYKTVAEGVDANPNAICHPRSPPGEKDARRKSLRNRRTSTLECLFLFLTQISVVVLPPPPPSAYHRFLLCFFPLFATTHPVFGGNGGHGETSINREGARGCVRPGMGRLEGELSAVFPVIVASPELLVLPVVDVEVAVLHVGRKLRGPYNGSRWC